MSQGRAPLEAGKGLRRLSLEPRDSPAPPLLITPPGPRWTDDLVNHKVINTCCLKPGNLQQFIVVVTHREALAHSGSAPCRGRGREGLGCSSQSWPGRGLAKLAGLRAPGNETRSPNFLAAEAKRGRRRAVWLWFPARRRLLTSSWASSPHVPGHCLWPEGPRPCRPRPSLLLLCRTPSHGTPGYRAPPESTRADPGQLRRGVRRASAWGRWFSDPGLGPPPAGLCPPAVAPVAPPRPLQRGRDVRQRSGTSALTPCSVRLKVLAARRI